MYSVQCVDFNIIINFFISFYLFIYLFIYLYSQGNIVWDIWIVKIYGYLKT